MPRRGDLSMTFWLESFSVGAADAMEFNSALARAAMELLIGLYPQTSNSEAAVALGGHPRGEECY